MTIVNYPETLFRVSPGGGESPDFSTDIFEGARNFPTAGRIRTAKKTKNFLPPRQKGTLASIGKAGGSRKPNMTGFLTTVLWTECLGQVDPKCPKFANRERMPAYKAKCACGGKVRPITKIDPLRAAMVAVLVLGATAGLGALVRASVLDHPRHGANHGEGARPAPQPAPVHTPDPKPAEPPISWTVEAIHGGQRSTWTAADFDRSGNAAWPRRVLSAGDRVRLDVTHRTGKLYAFYRNSTEASFLSDDSRGHVTLPASSHWFELDGNSSHEEFVLIGADRTLPELEPMTGNFDPVALDLAIRKIEAAGNIPVARLQLGRR